MPLRLNCSTRFFQKIQLYLIVATLTDTVIGTAAKQRVFLSYMGSRGLRLIGAVKVTMDLRALLITETYSIGGATRDTLTRRAKQWDVLALMGTSGGEFRGCPCIRGQANQRNKIPANETETGHAVDWIEKKMDVARLSTTSRAFYAALRAGTLQS